MQNNIIPYPVYNIFLNINNGCNLHCSYCWYNQTNNNSKYQEMTQKDLITSLNLIKNSIIEWRKQKIFFEYPKIKVALATKEPLLSFYSLIQPVLDTYDFKDYFDIYLLTNGTLLTQEIINWCISKQIIIQISLDGNKISHNANRQNFDKIFTNIQMIPNHRENLFLVSTIEQNTIQYVKDNLLFFNTYFTDTSIKFNFNIFKHWTNEMWNSVLKQFQEFIKNHNTEPLEFLRMYRTLPLFLDDGRGYIVGIDYHGRCNIKKPFHSSIPVLQENSKLLNQFNYGNIDWINFDEWIRYLNIFGQNFSKTRFVNINDNCNNCEYNKQCFNYDILNTKQKYILTDDECNLKRFRLKLYQILSNQEVELF